MLKHAEEKNEFMLNKDLKEIFYLGSDCLSPSNILQNMLQSERYLSNSPDFRR